MDALTARANEAEKRLGDIQDKMMKRKLKKKEK